MLDPRRGAGPGGRTAAPPAPTTAAAARVVATPPSLARVSVSVEGRPRESMVMRYKAGETGHGGVDEAALQRAGFSAGEASSVYVGNWLRDLSQLAKHPRSRCSSASSRWGEFNRNTSAEELGSYVPSEHLDDPRGPTRRSRAPATKLTCHHRQRRRPPCGPQRMRRVSCRRSTYVAASSLKASSRRAFTTTSRVEPSWKKTAGPMPRPRRVAGMSSATTPRLT